MTSVDPEEWANYDLNAASEPDAPSELEADPDGVPVNVRSSSDWKAVTMPDVTFLGVALATRASRDGVAVPGATYSGSCSSSEVMTRRADRATDFERPRA